MNTVAYQQDFLRKNPILREGISGEILKEYPDIESLDIIAEFGFEDEHFKNTPNLKELHTSNNNVTSGCFQYVPKVEILSAPSKIRPEDFKHLKNLRKIYIDNIDEDIAEALYNISTLEEVVSFIQDTENNYKERLEQRGIKVTIYY